MYTKQLADQLKIIYEGKPVLKYCEQFSENDRRWNLHPHSHPYIEMIYYLEGKAGITVGGVQIKASLYDTLVYPAHCQHHDGVSGERKRENICLWVDLPALIIDKPLQLHEQGHMISHLFRMIHDESKRKKPDPYMTEYLVKLLLSAVLRQSETENDPVQLPNRVLDYINAHFAEKLSLQDLAGMEHVSISYLSRKFKQYTGISIITCLNQIRIEAARQLLVSTEKSIEQIAEDTGFESSKYFCRVFRRLMGESPSAFRKAYISSK